MSNETGQVVWILGAGFSHSLGGPLFGTLFGPWSMAKLEAHFPPTEFKQLYGPASGLGVPAVEIAHWLYNYGRRFALGRLTDQGRMPTAWSQAIDQELWQDSEEYLQKLDRAAHDSKSPWARWISGILKKEVSGWTARSDPEDLVEINGAGRRLLAAECSAFMKDFDLESEPAIPYLAWNRQLGKDHTIITFNYDTVLEKLGERLEKIHCILPGESPRKDMAVAYKLHGSVDWLLEDKVYDRRRVERCRDPFAALNSELHTRIVMGTPGPMKSKLAETLSPLWEAAGVALRQANAIVFVGYRFPPTDTYAQKFILDAIEGNGSACLAVHVVLGKDPGSDSVRLQQLLKLALSDREETGVGPKTLIAEGATEYASAKYLNLRVWSFYAADFLGRMRAPEITQPFKYR